MDWLQLAFTVVRILTPIAMRVAEALATNRDPIEMLAAESVASILPATSRIEAAQAAAHLRQAHERGDTADLSPQHMAFVEHALALDALVASGAK